MNVSEHYLYPTWHSIQKRCYNPSRENYENYGGRGITNYWHNDSRGFIEWVEQNLGARPDGMTIDRIDNDGNYEPGNLRWAPRGLQNSNRRAFKRRTLSVNDIKLRQRGKRWCAHVNAHGGKQIHLSSNHDKIQCIVDAHIKFNGMQ